VLGPRLSAINVWRKIYVCMHVFRYVCLEKRQEKQIGINYAVNSKIQSQIVLHLLLKKYYIIIILKQKLIE